MSCFEGVKKDSGTRGELNEVWYDQCAQISVIFQASYCW